MQSVNALKIDAVAEFATTVYASDESAAMAAQRGVSREALALSVTESAQTRRILPPALRARLDRMTGEYAAILKRLDDLRVVLEGESVPDAASERVC